MNRLRWYCLLLLLSVTLHACVRERDTDVSLAVDLAFNEFVYHDASDLADDAATKNTGENLSNYKTSGFCAMITHNKSSNTKTITIDFGSTNCMCNDGRNRRGKIQVSYTGNYADSGSVHTITFDQYYLNDILVMGSNVVVNEGLNTSLQPFFSSTVEGKVVKPGEVDTFYYSAKRAITWIQGHGTPVWSDDIYTISGTATGRNTMKLFYAMTISKPLQKEVTGCRYFNQGKIDLQPQGKALRTIDFGDGTCDSHATVTFNNKVYQIDL